MKPDRHSENGNALIYVLIAIALFAALSLTLGRQTDTGEVTSAEKGRGDVYTMDLIAYAGTAQSVIDQLIIGNTRIGELDFTLPGAGGFETGSPIDKVYHPQGGGLTPGTLPGKITDTTLSDPPAGWYLGRVSNVDWSASANADVMLIAYGINEEICGNINENVTGTRTIPTLSGATLPEVFIDNALHSAGSNEDLTTTGATPVCAECAELASLCVTDAGGAFGYYAVLAEH